jgi:hypothetical protein
MRTKSAVRVKVLGSPTHVGQCACESIQDSAARAGARCVRYRRGIVAVRFRNRARIGWPAMLGSVEANDAEKNARRPGDALVEPADVVMDRAFTLWNPSVATRAAPPACSCACGWRASATSYWPGPPGD